MKMIFHTVLPVVEDAKNGPQMRLNAMIEAFKSIGYEVELIDGFSKDRKKKIKSVVEKIKNGEKYKFIYSESGTEPTFFVDREHRNILYYKLDSDFISFLNKNKIPSAIFYRDIYWKFFNVFNPKVHKSWKQRFRLFMYKYDLYWYKNRFNLIYLPSMTMMDYLPEFRDINVKALPPGHNVTLHAMKKNTIDGNLKIIYVGAVGHMYKIHKILSAIKKMDHCELIICTRENEWQLHTEEYTSLLSPRVKIVHASGDDLAALYKEADVSCLFLEPNVYREFAQPVKLYEYIGFELPVIATKNTLAGQFVEDNDIGWTINYDELELHALINKIIEAPEEILQKRKNIIAIREKHTWEQRAKQVASDMKSIIGEANEISC